MKLFRIQTLPLVAVLSVTTFACDRPDVQEPQIIERENLATQPRRVSQAELPHLIPATQDQQDLYNGARLALISGNQEDAFTLLQKLRETSELSSVKRDGVLIYAELLEQRDRLPEAVTLLRDFAAQIPPNGDVFFVLARMHLRRGEVAEAERALRDATRAAPELLRAWIALAELLEERGQRDEADEIMLRYEREVYRLGRVIERGATLEQRIAAIGQLRVAMPDPRISRLLAAALQNDAFDVQGAALSALEFVGTSNAVQAIENYIQRAPSSELQRRATDVLRTVSKR